MLIAFLGDCDIIYRLLVLCSSPDLGDIDSVLLEFDNVLADKATADNHRGLIDAASLLWRLNVVGVDPGDERWSKVTNAMATRAHNHRMPW